MGMQYFKTMKTRQDRYLVLESVIDRTLPGIGGVLNGYDKSTGKDKKSDFVYDFYHAEKITVYSENRFCDRYESWSKKKGYRYSEKEARQLYSIAKDSIPTLPSSENTKLMIQDAVKILREVDSALYSILNQNECNCQEVARVHNRNGDERSRNINRTTTDCRNRRSKKVS